jgi:serine/threonine protein kinase
MPLPRHQPAARSFPPTNLSLPDLKPDNILLDWEPQVAPDGGAAPPRVSKVVVSDLDSCSEMKGWEMRPTADYRDVKFGNVRWRAPEIQTGFGIGLFSDVFACALVVSGPPSPRIEPPFANARARSTSTS